MEHVFFAKFPRREDAEGLLRAIEADGMGSRAKAEIVGPDVAVASDALPVSLSNVRAAVLKGLLIGGLAGAVFGAGIGAAGLGPSMGVTATFAGLLGALAGVLGSVLIGLADPDENLERMATHMRPGEIIVSFHAQDFATEEDLIDRARGAGGKIVHRAGIGHIGEKAEEEEAPAAEETEDEVRSSQPPPSAL